MRAFPLLPALALATLSLPVPAQAAPATILIVEVLPDPDATLGQREFVELLNPGAATIDLGGWRLRDAPTASGSVNAFTFPAWPLGPGERVVVWGGGAGDASGPAWTNAAAWNNAGDGVTLLDAGGQAVDWVGYGSTAPPANASVQAKPGKGQSLAWDGSAWSLDVPSPGTPPGAARAGFEVEVANAPPVLSLTVSGAPRPGAPLQVVLAASDPNGDGDLASWSLAVNGVAAAGGEGKPTAVEAAVPSGTANVQLLATVTDRAGESATATWSRPVVWTDVAVSLPPGGLGLPPLVPGSAVESTGALRIENLADGPRTPRLDLSSLHGPAHVRLAGLAELGLATGNGTAWIPYSGPLTALPGLQAGQSIDLRLRITLPHGLPAGRYGATLAVVA